MPGIVGIIGIGNHTESSVQLDKMLGAMLHEPFYVSGKYSDESLGLWVGWNAQSNSASIHNPIWNETKDICIIFIGENFTDVRTEYRTVKTGHGNYEDPSYLVRLYEKKGINFLELLNGWFCGVLVDLRKSRIILFNDRYGLGRVYVHEAEGSLYFSSEAKCLLKVLPHLRQLDYQGVAETFSCGCVLQDRTLFKGISLLPIGSKWLFDKGNKPVKERYFDTSALENQALLNSADYYDRLKSVFNHLLPRYLSADNPIAMSLTGGLDGRMIMAYANKRQGELPCYSFGGVYRDCFDVRIARRIAKACSQPHQTITVGKDFFPEFLSLAERCVYISDGTMDVGGAVELYVNRIARQIAPIRLTGNYGSEIVRGNVAFRPTNRYAVMLEPEFAKLVAEAAMTYEQERQGHWLSFIAFKQVPWHHYSRFSVEQSQLTVRSPYLDNDLVSLMYQASYQDVQNKQHSLKLIAEGNAGLAKIPTDRGLLYSPLPLLTLLQHQYAEFTAKAEYAYDYGMPQSLAKIDHLFAPLHLEKLFLGQHKFYHFRVWYRDELASCIREILLDQRTLERSFFRPELLEKMVSSHIKGDSNYTLEIHRALTVELMQRTLIDRI